MQRTRPWPRTGLVGACVWVTACSRRFPGVCPTSPVGLFLSVYSHHFQNY